MLNVIDEFTRECLAIRVNRKLRSTDVIDVLSDLFILRGVPGHIRSDNGPEFVAKAVREWIAAVGAKTAYIEPGSPWENGYCESFNSKLRDELLNGEIFYTLQRPGHHRGLATALQHHPAALIARLQTAGAGGLHARASGSAIRPSRSARAHAGTRPSLTNIPTGPLDRGRPPPAVMSRAARGLRPADGCEVLASREGQYSTGAAAWRCVVLTDRGRPYRGWWWRGNGFEPPISCCSHTRSAD